MLISPTNCSNLNHIVIFILHSLFHLNNIVHKLFIFSITSLIPNKIQYSIINHHHHVPEGLGMLACSLSIINRIHKLFSFKLYP